MSVEPAALRSENHSTIGLIILQEATVIVERWASRAREEQPSAKRVHHDVLLDHLPTFLWEVGRALSESTSGSSFRHCRTANVHGDQRWEAGWSVEEVVRDYQLLRIVTTEYLDENIDRALSTHEILALGVFIDDAIATSVAAYTACLVESLSTRNDRTPQKGSNSDSLLEILGVLGHELRNPLAPLGNGIHVLKASGDDPKAVERVRLMMDRQFRVMTRLVDDLLDLPRLLRGKMQLLPDRVDLTTLTKDVVGDRRLAFDTAGVSLKLELPDCTVETTGDVARLSQVLGNILTNALKFTDRGGEVTVRLELEMERRVAKISVRDTGIGIERDLLAKVFDPFVQAERSVDRSRGGLGLGLALVRGLVELHGGEVMVESDGAAKGSQFTVELPVIPRSDSGAFAPSKISPTVSRRIVIIEDNRDSAESLKMSLETLGHDVLVALNGADGMALAKASAPEVVVCDIGLPGMSGHAVCGELKSVPCLSNTLFIALSGHSIEKTETPTDFEIFELYLLKPVDPTRLANIISTMSVKN